MSLISEGLQQHIGTLLEAHGNQKVVFARGSSTVTLDAALGRTDYDDTVTGDLTVSVASVDFIVDAAALVLGGQRVEPDHGDTVTRSDGSVYDVLPGNGGSPSTPNDGNASQIRIRTIRRKRAT